MIKHSPINLMSLDRSAMEHFFSEIGEQRYRAKQLLQWIYQRQVMCYQDMTDLHKSLRQKLSNITALELPEIIDKKVSKDGTCKLLLRLKDGNCIETVYIPDKGRGTLCVSSEVGCSLNCTFCATARQGYNRHLNIDEIISQLWIANQVFGSMGEDMPQYLFESSKEGNQRRPVTNVVMMGMGEPLLNFDNVVPAMRLMMDDYSFGLSKRKITLSTAGMVPMIDKLRETCPVSLAVSLHAPFDDLRNKLVPLNKKYPIAELLAACGRYVQRNNRQRITFEYVMLEGVNDTSAHANALAKVLGDIPSKVNLIPFNPFKGISYRRSSHDTIKRFRDMLLAKDIFTITRRIRGDDIDAACGQLAGRVRGRTKRLRIS